MRKSRIGFHQNQEARACLETFVAHFIERRARERWIHILCERPEKAAHELRKFDRDRVPARCTPLSSRDSRDSSVLSAFGDAEGAFFDGRSPARMTSLAQVLKEMGPFQDDALFASAEGPAVVFHHEGMTWLCRPPEG